MILRYQTLFLGLLLNILLAGCVAHSFTDAIQPQGSIYVPIEQKVGQTFIAQHAGLKGIELSLISSSTDNTTPVLHIRSGVSSPDDLVTARLDSPIDASETVRFSFPIQTDSHGQRYYFSIEGADLLLSASEQNVYPNGTMYKDDVAQEGDVIFAAVYESQTIVLDLLWFGLHLLSIIGIGLFLYVVPGLALVNWLLANCALHWGERLGLAAGASIALYPLIFLASRVMGLAIGEWLAWVPGVIGGVYILWTGRTGITGLPAKLKTAGEAKQLPDWILLGLLLLLTVVRILPVRTLPAPMWGDSVHHTFIVQRLVENGGLFDSWAPYAPIQTLTYHFGFHTAAAVWEWVTHMSAPQSVLIAGQLLNVLAVLALFPLAFRLSGRHRWAGVGAVLVAGFLSQMPGYYVNWGRYTQLAGQIIFPIFLWSIDVWLTERTRPKAHLLLLITILTTGLVLTHYRVATVAVAAGLAWTLWGLWLFRDNLREWVLRLLGLAGVALFAALLIIPWVMIVSNGRLSTAFTTVVTRDVTTNVALWQELQAWSRFGEYYPLYLWLGAVVAWLVAFWKRRELAVPMTFFALFVFIMTNPFLLGLPGTGWITNFLVIIGAYIPIALLLGWFFSLCIARIERFHLSSYALLALLLIVTPIGARTQLHVFDTASHQMVTQSDIAAFQWITANIPDNAYFLVNGFLAYDNSMAVGSDAGWWLPFYTQRKNNIPPMSYATEKITPQTDRAEIRQLILDVSASAGNPDLLNPILCNAGITHVYIGQRQGQVGYGSQSLIPAMWLEENSDFKLLHQEDQAQIWLFDRVKTCENP